MTKFRGLYIFFMAFWISASCLSAPTINQTSRPESSHPRVAVEPGMPQFFPTMTSFAVRDLPKITQSITPSPQPSHIPSEISTEGLPENVSKLIKRALLPGVEFPSRTESGSLRLTIQKQNDAAFVQWIYALVTPFPTISDEITFEDLVACWKGVRRSDFASFSIWVDPDTHSIIKSVLGEPDEKIVHVIAEEKLMERTWGIGGALAIVPFEKLDPRWKVILVDGQSPVRKVFDSKKYPLKIQYGLQGDTQKIQRVFALNRGVLPLSNRDPSKITTLAMTGVTALVRATAYRMEKNGVLYPGELVAPLLRSADITHISNEVPFSKRCPPPSPEAVMTPFCSNPAYIGLLESVGADVIELTGNHMQDFGSEATFFTLDLYRQKGMSYYGGGADLRDSQKSALLNHNGNKIAFIGCNAAGPEWAYAEEKRPGSAPCGKLDWIKEEIKRLRGGGYLPVVTFQYYEYYTFQPQLNQIRDFRAMVDAGAELVSGSQAHQPQGFEFYKDHLIHYGLGNLFFDQMTTGDYTRMEFIDVHIFYENRHISSELFTFMLEDYSKPRPATISERVNQLQKTFSASIWPDYGSIR